jgi:DNA-binding transcriptional LysR family regulator
MELRHLRYFIAVAEEENVSRAALRLHVSQPALSRQIRDLEGEIGVELLERTARSVRLTEAGKFFLSEARAVVLRSGEAVNKTRAIAVGCQGQIHVGYAPSLTVEILPRALRIFQKEYPKVRVMLHDLAEMLDGIRAGKLNVALMVKPDRASARGLKVAELARYPMQVAVAPKHPLAKSRFLTLAEVARQPLIGYSRQDYPEYHERLAALFSKVKARPRVEEEHDGVNGLIAGVEAGQGVALVPSCLACMAGPRLKLIPLKPEAPAIAVAAVWKQEALTPLVEKFLAAAGVGK